MCSCRFSARSVHLRADSLLTIAEEISSAAVTLSPSNPERLISLCHYNDVISYTLIQPTTDQESSTRGMLLSRAQLLALGTIIHFLGIEFQASMNIHKLLRALVLYINAARFRQPIDTSYSNMAEAILQGIPPSDKLKQSIHVPIPLIDGRLALTKMVKEYLRIEPSCLTFDRVINMLATLSVYGGHLTVTKLPEDTARLTDVILSVLYILVSPFEVERQRRESARKCTERAENLQEHIIGEVRQFSGILSQLAKRNEELSKELESTQQLHDQRKAEYKEETRQLHEKYDGIEMMLQQQGIEYRDLVRELKGEVGRLNQEATAMREMESKRAREQQFKEREEVDGGELYCSDNKQPLKTVGLEAIVDKLTVESKPEDVASAIVCTLAESMSVVTGGSSTAMSWELMNGVSYVYIKLGQVHAQNKD